MILMGYDPDDKSKLDEMRKGAGKNYAIAFIAILISARAGQTYRTQAPLAAPRNLDRFRGMAWFREHRAVDGRIVQQEAVQAVRDQYGIPVGLLFGDGDDSGGLGELDANAPQAVAIVPELHEYGGNQYNGSDNSR